MADTLTVTIQHVHDQLNPPDRVVSVEVGEDGADLDLSEIIDLLHAHNVYTYSIKESKAIVNWGASWSAQEIIVTVAALAQIIELLVLLVRNKRGEGGLTAEVGVDRASAFIKDNFAPQGELVSDGVTRTTTGVTMKFRDETCAYHVSISDGGMLLDATREPLKPPA